MPVAEQNVTEVPVGTWTVDQLHSSVEFEVVHNELSTFRGGFDRFGGTLTATQEGARIAGYGEVESVITGEEALDAHLSSPEFFDSERYPKVEFASKSLQVADGRLTGEGELTIRGNTLAVSLEGALRGPLGDASGGQRLAVDLETTIDRRSYGIEWQADLPDGGEVLSNDVRLIAHLELTKEA